MIMGTGVDVVNIDRFAELLKRTPGLKERLFVPSERGKPVRSLAARFAAKEATAKALGAPAGLVWHHCWVENDTNGAPYLTIQGTVAQRAHELGINRLHLTISHDEPVATATVMAERLSSEEMAYLAEHDPSPRGILPPSTSQ
ncbi:holo-ACP synthase [Rothia sp. P4278]|uniref:holo-ACP synthase n=1 Tax=Rothia sp. P4278 TaxID=3402658 RepID=UPI003AEAC969